MTLVGAGYRPELSGLFSGPTKAVECAELIADRYFAEDGLARPWELSALAGIPIVIHGLSGNVSSVAGPAPRYLDQIARLAEITDAVAYSDHLALSAAGGHALGHLAPNRFDDELLDIAACHIATIVERTGLRPRLENLATTVTISGSSYSPEEFYLRLIEMSDQWDCLVDLTNVWINAQNRTLDPVSFIDAIPVGRIGYVHLAGGRMIGSEWIDSHSQQVHEPVFELLRHLLRRAAPQMVIVERDTNWRRSVDEVRADVDTARGIVLKVTGAAGKPRP